jgi:dihydrofolate reductase
VLVHGAGAAQALLKAGLLDEMELHLVQVLLGEGRPLFGSRRRKEPTIMIKLGLARPSPARSAP